MKTLILALMPLLTMTMIFPGCSKDVKSLSSQTKDDATTGSVSSLADVTPPTVKFKFPTKEDTVSGTITINIKATDSVAVDTVQCKVDGVLLGTKTAAPYEFVWNTTTLMNGAHQLQAKAVDASGNSTTKKIIVHTLNPAVLPMEQQLLDLINAERSNRGLVILTHNSNILAAARRHAQDMADNNFFSHVGSDGSTLATRLNDAGYPWTSAAENLGPGQTTATMVFNAWMANTTQKSIMLDPSFKDAAVGCGYNNKSTFKRYWVLNIGKTD